MIHQLPRDHHVDFELSPWETTVINITSQQLERVANFRRKSMTKLPDQIRKCSVEVVQSWYSESFPIWFDHAIPAFRYRIATESDIDQNCETAISMMFS